jgi:hypothetical protein
VVAITLETVADLWGEAAHGVEALEQMGFRPTAPFAEIAGKLDTSMASLSEATLTAFFSTSLSDANASLDLGPPVSAQVDPLRAQAPSQHCDRGIDVCASCLLVGEVVRPISQVVRQYATIAQLTMNRALGADRETFGFG